MSSLFSVRRLVLSVLLAAAVVAIVWAFTMHETTEPIRVRHEAVKAYSPEHGDQNVQQQATVFVELDPAYTLDALRIGTQAVGGDDIDRLANHWEFTPREGKSIERLPGGRTCATAEFRRLDRAGDPGTFVWCFFVS